MRCLFLLVVAAIVAAIISSCSSFPSGRNGRPNLSAADVAAVRSGAYTRIAGLDGRAVKHLDISVQPGSHILSIAFVKRAMGNRLSYTYETASLAFVARPGHTYGIDAEVIYESVWARFIVTDFSWIAYVTDKQEKERIAATDPLPLNVEHIVGPWYQASPL